MLARRSGRPTRSGGKANGRHTLCLVSHYLRGGAVRARARGPRGRDPRRVVGAPVMPRESCQICGEFGMDRRTLVIEYFYSIEEVSPKFTRTDRGYELRTCKGCRGDFLGLLRSWVLGKH